MREKNLVRQFRDFLIKHNPDIFYYKIPDTKGLGGMRPFDAIVIFLGKIYCLEFKVGNNKPTAFQKYSLQKASQNGAVACVVNDKNWSLVATWILNNEVPQEVTNGQ